METTSDMPDRLLKWPVVRERTTLSRTTVHDLRRKGQFPEPVKLLRGRVAWRERDVQDWIATRTKATP